MKKCKVVFYPGKEKISISKGTDILEAAIAAGIRINSSCGGEGICGRCKVKIMKGRASSDTSYMLNKKERILTLEILKLTLASAAGREFLVERYRIS